MTRTTKYLQVVWLIDSSQVGDCWGCVLYPI